MEAEANMPAENVQQATFSEIKQEGGMIDGIKWLIIIMAAVAIILLVVNIAFLVKLNQAPKQPAAEILNLTVTLAMENGTEIISNTVAFERGSVAKDVGFETNKLDEELGNLSVGESKTVTLEAKDAFGEYDNTKIFSYENRTVKQDRTSVSNRTTWITMNEFTDAFNEQPEVGKEYNISGAPWPYKVVDKNETNVKISQEAKLNQKIPFGNFFEYEIIALTDETITFKVQGNNTVIPSPNGNLEVNFTENEMIITLTPTVGQLVQLGDLPQATVTGMNATHIFLDANNPYAGKKIIATVTRNS